MDLKDWASIARAIQLEGEQTVVAISAREVWTLALKQNIPLQVAEINLEIASEGIRAEQGDFDPRLHLGVEVSGSDLERTQRRSGLEILAGVEGLSDVRVESDGNDVAAGVGGRIPVGLQYEVSIARGNEGVDGNALGADRDGDSSTATISLVMPLLKGAGSAVGLAGVERARVGAAASEAEVYLERQNTAAEALVAYWQLVGAHAMVQVRESALRTAEEMLSDTQQRNELGATSDLESITARAAVARRQNDLISACAQLGHASDQLKLILDLRDGPLLSRALLLPSDDVSTGDLTRFQVDYALEERVHEAWRRRPEMFIQDSQKAIAEITLRQRRNARLPALDLYGQAGTRDLDERYGEILRGRTEENSDFWTAGLKASVPIGNRRARAEYRSAKLRVEQEGREQSHIEALVDEDVRGAIRDVVTNVSIVENARRTVGIEQLRFRSEQERFLFGDSTAFHITQVQDTLIQEEMRLYQAEAQLQASLVNLYRAEGRLLHEIGAAELFDAERDERMAPVATTEQGASLRRPAP